ncbi:MAG: hypothetical protein R2769_13155 [Saprospiraceae bacterium]
MNGRKSSYEIHSEPKAYFDEARAYIWNPGHLPLYIDDLKIELVTGD